MTMPIRKQGFVDFPESEFNSRLNLTREVVWATYWKFKRAGNAVFEIRDDICIIPTAATWIENDDDDSTMGEVPVFRLSLDKRELKLAAEMRFHLDFSGRDDPEAFLWLQVEPQFTEEVLRVKSGVLLLDGQKGRERWARSELCCSSSQVLLEGAIPETLHEFCGASGNRQSQLQYRLRTLPILLSLCPLWRIANAAKSDS